MGAIASFDYVQWSGLFPSVARAVNPAMADLYWTLAATYHRNDGGGPVADVATQQTLLNLLTAHVAMLFAPDEDGNPPSAVVGRISSFSQGSASGAAEWFNQNPEASWYLQTPAGASYWAATSQYRTFRYTPARQRSFNWGWPPVGLGGNQWWV